MEENVLEEEQEPIDCLIYIRTSDVNEVYRSNNYPYEVQKKIIEEEFKNKEKFEFLQDDSSEIISSYGSIGDEKKNKHNLNYTSEHGFFDKNLESISPYINDSGLKSQIGKKAKKLREKDNER